MQVVDNTTRPLATSLLIVDDDEKIRDLLSQRLGRIGYAITTAGSGKKALELISEESFDLILLDIEMPDMSGLDVLKTLRQTKTPTELPVIVVSANHQSIDIVEALSLGANDYATKTGDFPVVLARVKTHLAHKNAEAALRESEERYALAAKGANDGLWDWNWLGHWVLQEACRQMALWKVQFQNSAPEIVCVNLSARQFAQPDLVSQLAQVLEETGLDARQLKLEMTESLVMQNVATASAMLKEMKTLGVLLGIDDFGTGYSSLSYLSRFPIDTLKVDSSFVSRIGEDKENLEIVRTIITLAHNLKMDVIAEGVETAEQLSQLRDLGCEYGQGYYFSQPVSAEEASHLIADLLAPPRDTAQPPTGPNGSPSPVLSRPMQS